MGCSNGKQNTTANDCRGGSSPSSGTGSPGKLLDKYTLGKVLGQGAFGIVYSCKKKGSKEEFAVKMIDKVETPLEEIKHEAKMLEELKHFSIVALHDVFYEKAFVCMVMTVYRGGDMIEGMQLHWKSKGMLDIVVVARVSKQMITSIEWLHRSNVVHRDVKGDNFLMDRKDIENAECRIFLSDFGTVRALEPATTRLKSKCGTKTYWAPEFFAMNYGLKVDVWALGVIMYGLVTGRFPFKGEDDVNNKKIQLPARATEDCNQLLKGLLNRNEEDRLNAKDALSHKFCHGAPSPKIPQEELPGGGADDGEQMVKDVVDTYQVDRRYVLTQAMKDVENQKKMMTAQELKATGTMANPLQVVHHNGKRTKLQWFDLPKARTYGLHEHQNAKPLGDDDAKKNAANALKIMEAMFKDHEIDVRAFGRGEAKTLDEFNLEIQKGTASLLLDASLHKKKEGSVVRVVDLVLIRISARGTNGALKYLIKKDEKFPDGRERKNVNQLPGTKKEPHENAMETLTRVVKDRMGLENVKVDFTKKETYEEDTISPSYPGIRTVYRTEIFEGTMAIAMPQLDNGQPIKTIDFAQYERSYLWITEDKCKQMKIRLKGDSRKDLSTLVHAPVSPKEEEIHKQLKAAGVDYKRWASGKFKVMTDELSKGEAALVDVDGKLLRVVDIVVVKVTKETKEVLAEVEEEVGDPGGEVVRTTLNWLPAVKRRPDENMYVAGKRCVNKSLGIDENAVTFDTGSVLIAEEEKESQTFPSLSSLYRKRIITANIVTDESNVTI